MPRKTDHKFTLNITLGNAAMCTGADVADKLRKIASLIEDRIDGNIASGVIMDNNGNKVGTWFLDVPESSDV